MGGDRRRAAYGRLLGAAVLLTAVVAPAQAADDAMLREARALIEADQAQAAYDLLLPHADARAGDTDFDFVFGVSALDSGRPEEAVFALERVLDVDPDNAAARTEVARAYYLTGEREAAKAEFEALKTTQPPEAVNTLIDRYLAAIDYQFSANRPSADLFIELGAGYDSNANSATDQTTVAVPAFGGVPITLLDGALEQGSPLFSLAGGFQGARPLAPDLALIGGASILHRIATDESQFSQTYFNANAGFHYLYGANQFRILAQGQRFNFGGDPNRDLAGASLQWQRNIDADNQLTAFYQGGVLRYPGQAIRDAQRHVGGVGWGHVLDAESSAVVFASLYLGTEKQDESTRDDLGRDFYGVRVGGQYGFTPDITGIAGFVYQRAQHNGRDLLFIETREDDYYDASISLIWQLDRNWSVRPEVRYTRNDSNIVLNEFDRVEGMVSVRNDF